MGGGSMNAASILNFFLKRRIVILNKKRILEVCEMVGNDVKIGLYKGPIFLNSNNSIQSLKKGLSYHLLIFKPKTGCSTKFIFSKFKTKRLPEPKEISDLYFQKKYSSYWKAAKRKQTGSQNFTELLKICGKTPSK